MIIESLLGKKTEYIQTYSPGLLYPVPRKLARSTTAIIDPLPFLRDRHLDRV